MTKLLVIRAHPFTSSTSRSMKVTDAFLEVYQENHPDIEVEDINLYSMKVPEIDGELLSAWDSLRKGERFYALNDSQQHKVTLFDAFTAGFMEADKVVVANPLWNLNVPTRLKAWFDTINVAGKTFKYTEEGSVGLMGDKKVLHIQASGGAYHGNDPASQYVKMIFNFLGVKDYEELFVEGMDFNPDKAPEIIEEAVTKAKELGKNF